MLVSSRLSIIFEVGTNQSGYPIFKTKNFNNIKETATDAQLTAIADKLAPLQQYPVDRVERTNIHSL